jgi:hypothetical protein
MLAHILIAVGLVVVTVAMHAAEFSLLPRAMMRARALDRSGFWVSGGLFFAFVFRWIGNWLQRRAASEGRSEAARR